MQSADITVRLPASMQLPVPDDLTDGFHREEMLSWRHYPDDGVVGFLSLVVGDVAGIRETIRDLPSVERTDITRLDDDTCYVYVELPADGAIQGVFGAITDRHVVIVPPVVYTDPETVHLTVLGEPDALSGLLSEFPDAVTVDVDRVGDHRRPAGLLAHRVTARQFDALETAWREGYYEVPRAGSLSDVADALDCSESTASTLLRNAESSLVGVALGK